jgi:hypothetical protein
LATNYLLDFAKHHLKLVDGVFPIGGHCQAVLCVNHELVARA